MEVSEVHSMTEGPSASKFMIPMHLGWLICAPISFRSFPVAFDTVQMLVWLIITLSHQGWMLTAVFFFAFPRSGELWTQKLKSHLVRTQSLNVLPLKPGVGQYIAIHATLTARDFFLSYFYTSGPFTCIFSKTSPDFSLCWLWLTHGSCVGLQNKIGHLAGCRFPCWVSAEYK